MAEPAQPLTPEPNFTITVFATVEPGPGLYSAWNAYAVVPLNLVEIWRNQSHVIKARNWLLDSGPPWYTCWSWANPASVSNIILAGQTPLLSHPVSTWKHLWQHRSNYCKRESPRCKSATGSVESPGLQELSVRKIYGVYNLQREM